MLTFNVSNDINRVAAEFKAKFASQIPFATAKALTKIAQLVQTTVTATLPAVFDRPTSFTMRALAIIPATKATLTSSVYIQPIQAQYLGLEIAGGVRMPTNAAIPVPVDIPLNQFGSMPRAIVAQLLRRADCFSGKVNGHPGIFQRTKDGKVIMLIGWAPRTEYHPRFDFAGIAQKVITTNLLPIFRSALQDAVATMR